MLGERLYPLVDQLEHDHAAKVTGMLLEMDKSEILHLLETHEALKAKVAEAMVVLRNVAGGMLSVPFDMGGMPIRDCSTTQPIPIGALASALANAATLEQHMTFLGERLYPLVDQLEHDHAAKVTGMLLEMDQTDILHLLESPEALKAKVTEAMKVLRDAAGDMLPSPYDKVHIPIQAIDILQPVPTEALALALANATPEQQRVVLGERLYPLVYQLVYDYAPKVTGMLLEMHQTEILHLLESPEALKAKVAEAMGVLRNAAGGMLPIPCDMCGMLSVPYDTGGMLFVPYDTGSLHFIQDFGITHLIPSRDLASAVADSTPEQQRVMLGERLYPLLDQLGIEHAVKAIGMLLKMDKTTALYLLDSLEAFKANVRGHGDSLKCCSAATAQSTV